MFGADLAEGVHLGLITSEAEVWGSGRPPSITTAKPRPQEGGKGVAKLKCTPTPAPVFALSLCPSSTQ